MNSNRHILIVEDSNDLRNLMAEFFRAEGLLVAAASDGAEALNYLRSVKQMPSVILLDLMMPGMDGAKFRAAQLSHPGFAQIPVLLMTADANAEIKAKQLATAGFLKKPIAGETLMAVAQKFCKHIAQ